MDTQQEKYVIIINESLPAGIIANTAAIMGITIGERLPQVVGKDVTDETGNVHVGITKYPVPILKASPSQIKELRRRLFCPEYSDLLVADFSDLAQSCKDYEDFTEKMSHSPEEDLDYFGLALCGSKKKINKLTGSMPLLR